MPRNARPRKAYRPRPVGRPVMNSMRRDLILQCYAALEVPRAGRDGCKAAADTLAGLANWYAQLLAADGRDTGPALAAMSALTDMQARAARLGAWRCSGPELAALRALVTDADNTLTLFQSHKLTAALATVYAAMGRIESQETA